MTFFEPGRTPVTPSHDWDDPFTQLHRERKRRGAAVAWAIVAVVAIAVAGVVIVVGPERVGQTAAEVFAGEPPPPAEDLIALADRSFLTDEGRRLLYRSKPAIVDREEIGEACPTRESGSTLGCYSWTEGIRVYQPADPRIADAAVTTLAHELLHAAYDALGTGERFDVHEMLYTEIERVPADDPVHAQIEGSVGEHESSRETELFAYLGSQIMPEGGFAPELEAVYSRWIADRASLVEVYRRVEAVMEGVIADARAANDQLIADETANAQERAQLEADRAWHERARATYNADADHYNALPPEERGQWVARWTAPDGTPMSQPLGESLQERLAELERYRAELDARAAALEAAEAAAVARRADLEAQWADVTALLESAYPGQSFG